MDERTYGRYGMSNLQDFFSQQFRLLGLQCAHDTVETSVRRHDGILRISHDPLARLTTLAWEPNGAVVHDDYYALKIATMQYAKELSTIVDMPWEVERKRIFVRAMVGRGLVKA